MAKTALFVNFTDQEFTGWWNGKSRKYKPGQSEYMPDYLAQHFAKHLVNQELLRVDLNGNLIHKDGDKMTSPKKPEQVPMFMELFNKAYVPDNIEEAGENADDMDSLIGAANKNREKIKQEEIKTDEPQDPTKPQTIVPPDFNDDEEEFEGKPEE